MVINRFYVGKTTKGVVMGMESVLQSIKNAEESALAKIAGSKDEAAKILADARKEASEIIQGAQESMKRHGRNLKGNWKQQFLCMTKSTKS